VDLEFTPAEQDFRAEARAWLADNVPGRLPSMDTRAGFEAHREWERRLFDARYSVVGWPDEYGGRNASRVEWLIFEEEYWAAGAPGRVSQNGIFLLAPVLFEYGTAAQRERFLRRMARADDIWAQAWSEPEAGSDLASLKATAEPVTGGWLLRGRKTWSSRAAYADWGFGLFRSAPHDRDLPRHRGLTYFMFPLDEVEIRPIPQLGGEPGFAELYFDDVFVPGDLVLGAPGEGWRIAMATTSSERGLTLRSPGRFMATADRLVRLARELDPDPALADQVARAWLDAEAYRLHTYRAVAGGELGPATSMGKVWWSELDIRLHTLALQLLGERGIVAGPWLDGYLFSLAGPIYAGTNEIQRTIVAERVLGLPR
jgi:alkylation response protein AidB-like acyl-CoA dehydrogenase